ncbi:MAG: sulfatase-like hydrolase/transferase [Caulobacteraceae bacterium]|nr:sulfatase-like hydrolase/transferase [Caulobacteraceae bacterium]
MIVILADDLGYGDVGAYGSKVIRTPNIDALAASGVRFTDAYVSHPVCSPSRAGLLTGRYQERFGYEFNPVGRDRTGGVSLQEVMIGQIMKSAGYETGMVGKWHLGGAQGYHPSDRGFDEFFGMTAGASTYIVDPKPTDQFYTYPGSEGAEHASNESAQRAASMTLPERLAATRKVAPITRGRTLVDEREYLTDAFTRESVDFIERHKDKPFFLYVAYNAPHTPLQAPKKYLDRYPATMEKGPRIYAAMVSALDDGVGAIRAKLKQTGLEDDTLIVFLSDNGCASDLHGACSNAPLSGFKGEHLEGGVRVPYLVSWPGHVRGGVVDRRTISSLDIVPTAAALAGATLPQDREYDGVDLLPFLKGADKAAPHQTLYWRAGVTYAIRDGDKKMWIANRAPPGVTSNDKRNTEIAPEGMVAEIGPAGQHVMLYDLTKDIGEKHNIAASNPELVAQLKAKLAKWSDKLGKPQWTSRRHSFREYDDVTLQLFN